MGALLATLWQALTDPDNAGQYLTVDDLQPLVNGLQALASWLQDLFSSEMAAWRFSHPQVVGGAWGLGQIAYNDAVAWKRLLTVILPNSLAWLDGHTHQWVDAKYDWQLAAINRWEVLQDQWDQRMINWQEGYANPHIRDWRRFNSYYHTWPIADSNQLHSWLKHPVQWGEWMAPLTTGPMVTYLAAPARQRLRNKLTALLVDATPNVWRHVERATVAVLLTEQ